MHILLTRPLEDCSEMILRFKSLGHQISHLPLIKIEPVKHKEINISDYKGIIFTSANAVKFLNVKNIDKKILCFCVGSATEKKARNVGFQNVISAGGNVTNLKELVLQNFDANKGKLIYFSGELISVDLDKELKLEGYDIDKIINYRAVQNKEFDENFISKLKLNIKIYQSESLWMNTNLMCIGEKTSSILNEIKWKKIFLFNPGEEEFLLYKI